MFAAKNAYLAGARTAQSIVISANTFNYTLNPAKVATYIPGKTDVTLTINSAVQVGSSSTSTAAFIVDTSWQAGDTITIINNGYIVGAGGNGGVAGGNAGGGPAGGNNGTPGLPGGPALTVQRAVSINNASGTVGGGGGGGGGGGTNAVGVATGRAGAGGGGAGYAYSSGGWGAGSGNGSPGTLLTGGAGVGATTDGGAGGNGGNLGFAGQGGSPGDTYSGSPGGAAGNATTTGSNALITWIATGTRLGTLG